MCDLDDICSQRTCVEENCEADAQLVWYRQCLKECDEEQCLGIFKKKLNLNLKFFVFRNRFEIKSNDCDATKRCETI